METPQDRLNKVYKELVHKDVITDKQGFADLLEYNVSYTSQLLNGKRGLTQGVCQKLFAKARINPDWLLTGKGQMIAPSDYIPGLEEIEVNLVTKENPILDIDIEKTMNKKPVTGDEIRKNKATKPREQRRVPLLGEAGASNNLEMDVPVTGVDQYIDVGDLLRDSEAAFTVYGNSMTPSYPPGCVLGLKRCYDSFIQPGEVYVVETRSNRVIKRLRETPTHYKCYSDNQMKYESGEQNGEYFYPMFEIPKAEVLRLFDVVGMIKRTRNSSIIQRVQ